MMLCGMMVMSRGGVLLPPKKFILHLDADGILKPSSVKAKSIDTKWKSMKITQRSK
jgi:hypothetical protein